MSDETPDIENVAGDRGAEAASPAVPFAEG